MIEQNSFHLSYKFFLDTLQKQLLVLCCFSLSNLVALENMKNLQFTLVILENEYLSIEASMIGNSITGNGICLSFI